MAEYSNREKRFNDSLPGIVGSFIMSVSLSDAAARMANVGIVQQILNLPNVSVQEKIDILNRDKPLVFAADHPAAMYAETRPFLPESATLKMSMSVSASTFSEKSLDSSSEGSGKATFGFGLFKGEIGMKANVSTHSSQKRESDYSATTDMELVMSRHPLPEGFAQTLQAMGEFAKAGNAINLALAQQEISRAANADELKLPEDTKQPEPDEAEGEEAETPTE